MFSSGWNSQVPAFLQPMKSWAHHLYSYYKELKPPSGLPDGTEWLYPQQKDEVMTLVKKFLDRYFLDRNQRTILLGINPGRFGAGITGINFTAPRQLSRDCHIPHHLGEGSELSAEFIYAMIHAFGGPEKFYGQFFIGSVSPLGFIKGGKNQNYYDDPSLLRAVEPFIITNMERLLKEVPYNANVGFSIGGEKNFRYLKKLNDQKKWFENLIPLPHPRYIMQYKRKQIPQFIELYLQLITKKNY